MGDRHGTAWRPAASGVARAAVFAVVALGCDRGHDESVAAVGAGGTGAGAGCEAGELLLEDGSCLPAGLPPAMPCPPGELWLDDGSCAPAGLPLDLPCPPGQTSFDGACRAAGVPPDGCADGFVHDGASGCDPVLPADPCPAGTMALPGESQCREVAPCGSGSWGDIPVEASTEYVDASYAGGDSDGSAAKPWTLIQDAVAQAQDGALVAIAAGNYTEDVFVQDKAIRLWGRCPSMVAIVGSLSAYAAVDIRTAADGSELHDLAVTGQSRGVVVDGSLDVLVEGVWIHDTGDDGLTIENALGDVSAAVRGVLLERATRIGVLTGGAQVTIDETVVRDTLTVAGGYGLGMSFEDDPFAAVPSDVVVTRSLVERNTAIGISSVGSSLVLEGSVVRETIGDGDGKYGYGVSYARDWQSGGAASGAVWGSLIADSSAIGLLLLGSEVTIEATVIRGVTTDASGQFGYGLVIQSDAAARARSSAVVRSTLVAEADALGLSVSGSDAVVEDTLVRDAGDGLVATSWGVAIQLDPLTAGRSTATLRRSEIADCRGIGVYVAGADATLESTWVHDTGLDGSGAFGRGVNAEIDPIHAQRASLFMQSSLVERNHEIGVAVVGSDATLERSAVRDTLANAAGMLARGIDVEAVPGKGERADATVRGCLVQGNGEVGVLVSGADAVIESSVVRDPAPRLAGRGITVQDQPPMPGTALIRACLVENNRAVGIALAGGDGTLEATVVRGTLSALDGDFGRGINVQPNLDVGTPGSLLMRSCVIEDNREVGVAVLSAEATIEATLIRATAPNAEDQYGDGLVVSAEGAPATASLLALRIEDNVRAGVANFGAAVTLGSSTLSCQAFDLDGESYLGQPAAFEDLGGNACGCAGAIDECRAVSANLSPLQPLGEGR